MKEDFYKMKKLTSAEIRRMYLDFFQEKGHKVEPSASLVPIDDPTLLWINSGVATLKKYFDGRVKPENPRITNAQKSIRTNDIENVGKTARHHTFFEMLGNFSIGDYFKEEAIIWAWEFLTSSKWIGFEPEKLSVTVHPEDDEAYQIWRDKVGIPEERIIRLEGNFWDIGEGPSGPNSEIFYDRGPDYGNNLEDPELYPGGENERYLEIWNLVFSQFNHNPDGTYTPLPKKNIDTGMGLERMVSVIQDTKTNFETDLFMPIIRQTEQIAGVKYGESVEKDVAFKVIADHTRTVAFAIGDGALPSNEGRGYVLRRLLRRAVRYAKQINIEKPFMYDLVPVVGEIMEDYYPEVKQKTEFIQRVIKNEEERFHETLNDGLAILSDLIKTAKEAGKEQIDGVDVFRLYDTYGFPVELTEEYAEEAGMKIDINGFEREMEMQRDRARKARQDVDSMQVQGGDLGDFTKESSFIGYNQLETETKVLGIFKDGTLVSSASDGEQVQVILEQTPFYAEMGGEIGDRGKIFAEGLNIDVVDVKPAPHGQNLHYVKVIEGKIEEGQTVHAHVEHVSRGNIQKNHSATHLLHKALKEVLGDHVNQAGSLVEADRLRFDFSHFGQVTEEELTRIEQLVNEQIWQSIPVETLEKGIDEAKAMGAMALFSEKYGDVVRVVKMADFSIELCGGCHVPNTSVIGLFKIVSESGIGAGTRRIEAVTGEKAYQFMNEQIHVLREAASKLKSNLKDVPAKIDGLQHEIKELNKEIESLTGKLSHLEAGNLMDSVKQIDGVNLLVSRVEITESNQLRTMLDDLKQKLESGIIVLGAVHDDKVQLIAGVTKDLVGKYHAGKLIKEVAGICGGGGGGRPDMAQAGGKDPNKLDEALQFVEEFI
jgi:alanyl-tRNA synthetase